MNINDSNTNEKTHLTDKFSENEMSRIVYLVKHDLPKTYVLPYFLTIYQEYKHKYMVSTTIIMLMLILGFDWPFISFFAPLIPILSINAFVFIETNVITYKMNKVHNQLISEKIQIQWDELMDVVMQVIVENFMGYEDDNNEQF